MPQTRAELEVAALLHDIGRRRGLERDLGEARPALGRRVGAGAHARLPLRADPGDVRGRSRRWRGSRACTTSGWTARATTAAARARELPPAARVLAAADAFQAMTRRARIGRRSARSRPRRSSSARSARAASTRTPRRRCSRPPGPAARGATTCGPPGSRARGRGRAAGRRGLLEPRDRRRLVISRRTAEHHVQHIYAKVGVSSRAGLRSSRTSTSLIARPKMGRPTDARRGGRGEASSRANRGTHLMLARITR